MESLEPLYAPLLCGTCLEKGPWIARVFPDKWDIDFQLRFGEVNRVFYRPDFTYFYRIHDASITHTQPSPLSSFTKQLPIDSSNSEWNGDTMISRQDLLQHP